LEIKLFTTKEICHTNSDKYLKIHIQNIYIMASVSHTAYLPLSFISPVFLTKIAVLG